MRALDRITAAVAGEATDRVPAAPYVANWAAGLVGIPLSVYGTDPAQMARATIAAQQALDLEVVFPDCDNYYLAEGFGCRSAFRDDEIASLEHPAVEGFDDVFDLEVPDPTRDGRMPVVLEAISRIRTTLGPDVVIRAPGTGPFALASYLVGIDSFLLAVAKLSRGREEHLRPALERMLDLTTEALIRFGLAEIEAGADMVQCGDSLASCSVISPATFEQWVLPYHRKVFSAWKEAGATTLLHVCGNNTGILQLLADTGADIVAIDHLVDLATAKKEIGGRVALIGNLDPVTTVRFGSPDDVALKAEAALADAADGGRFILGTGCEVPVGTPIENLRALLAAPLL
ncbi:uroporphyrinogen decarboxylase family protein [bacterium]|nr:uroporphyrinogen decarboxylase family protein [bacterium]